MKEHYDIMRHKQRQNPTYWLAWARSRGAHYFAVCEPWETPEFCAPSVSADKWLQDEFIEGWKEAQEGA